MVLLNIPFEGLFYLDANSRSP
uniref:Uncharacterized protein n=1 Tax=Arundo donax TaxID=35708 RepID=A0A0A8Z2F3_ARUDO